MKSFILETMKTCRRYGIATYHRFSPKNSYSQNGEDVRILEDISNDELRDGIYIEVGGNHPTLISNTYGFYKLGASGIIVEPNPTFKPLYRRFRPRDTHLQIGCGKEPGLFEFFDNGSTDVSGFVQRGEVGVGVAYFPVLPLAALDSIVKHRRVFLLTIDVEGMDFDVIEGAGDLLNKVDRVLIEYGDDHDRIDQFLKQAGFRFVFRNIHNGYYVRS